MHRAAAQQRRVLVGRTVAVTSPQGRFADEAALLDGGTVVAVDAHGKHLFQSWDHELVVHVHLGLFGRYRVQRTVAPTPPRGQVRVRWQTDGATLDLSGPTICALTDAAGVAAVRARLGPDPLRADADPDRFVDRVLTSGAPIGRLLMDQRVIAGVGNVYRAEVLHLAGIDPMRAGRTLDRASVEGLWDLLVELMRVGVRRGRIVTAGHVDPTQPANARGVYHRRTCGRCGRAVDRTVLDGRDLYACPNCQR